MLLVAIAQWLQLLPTCHKALLLLLPPVLLLPPLLLLPYTSC